MGVYGVKPCVGGDEGGDGGAWRFWRVWARESERKKLIIRRGFKDLLYSGVGRAFSHRLFS